MKKVNDVCNRELVTITRETALPEIIAIMKEKKVGKLPVIENGILVGMVTRDDLLVKEESAPIQPVVAFWEVLLTLPVNKHFDERVKKMSAYTANELMNQEFYKVSQEDELEEVVTNILEMKYGYAVVVEGDKLIGLVTKGDLISKCF